MVDSLGFYINCLSTLEAWWCIFTSAKWAIIDAAWCLAEAIFELMTAYTWLGPYAKLHWKYQSNDAIFNQQHGSLHISFSKRRLVYFCLNVPLLHVSRRYIWLHCTGTSIIWPFFCWTVSHVDIIQSTLILLILRYRWFEVLHVFSE